MKVAWWMYSNTDWDTFTVTTPRTTVPVMDELVRRGHEIVLNHIPRPPHGSRISAGEWEDPGPYANNWDPYGLEVHSQLMQITRENGGFDPQNRAQRAMAKWLESDECKPVEADVQVIKLFPCVSLLAKLEVAHAVLRAVLSDVPVILYDGEFGADCVISTCDDLYKITGWNREQFMNKFYLFAPYLKRIWRGNQVLMMYPYMKEAERELDEEAAADYTFGYVGNDYQRSRFLGEFYKSKLDSGEHLSNAIWGRWRKEQQPSEVDPEAFLGTVIPRDIPDCYQKCAASIVIAHAKYYSPKLITQRWAEVLEAGRLLFVDHRLDNEHPILKDFLYCSSPETAFEHLEWLISNGSYWDAVRQQRALLHNEIFSASHYADAVEAVSSNAHMSYEGFQKPLEDLKSCRWGD